ncbi:MAG: outer-membrane lipoprotein carrier protein LolA [Hyphomicrobiales bacterium]|nr:outer-membrane lipoprotein carrier protein LolA [Hyphomicrobiales bacterium]
MSEERKERLMKRIGMAAIAVAILAIIALAVLPAQARTGIELNEDQIAIVRQINAYINSLGSVKGRFTQIGPDGEFAEGNFYLQRPGRMRFEYSPPNPILVVADGFWVGIEDRKLQSTQKYPLVTTPLSLLLGKRVDLFKDARIVGFERRLGDIEVTVEAASGSAPGQLTLIFGGPIFALKQWTVVDAQGLTTQVAVFDLVAGLNFDPKLFWINDNLILNTNER